MKKIKGTKTEKNLLAAFAGESQARNRYTFFSSIAKKEGYEQISAIFTETADNEKEHAKLFFKLLEGGEVEITSGFPAGIIGDTKTNLQQAAAGENFEHTKLYPQFASDAEKEGYTNIAEVFKNVAKVEVHHEQRYLMLLENIKNNTVFKKDKVVKWKCRNCGYVFEGKEVPEKCPVCAHPRAFFELLCDNF